jgi:hypothetical protein
MDAGMWSDNPRRTPTTPNPGKTRDHSTNARPAATPRLVRGLRDASSSRGCSLRPRLTLPGLLKSRKVTDLWRRRGTARTSSAATLHAQNDPRTLAQSFASLEWVSFPAHFSVELGIGGAYQSKVAHIALADTPHRPQTRCIWRQPGHGERRACITDQITSYRSRT